MSADVIIIGAGVVGAACAWYLTRAGLRVTVLDRGPVAGGTTSAGEGNLLVSDKPAGPELDLAIHSATLWRNLADEVGGFEYEPKGGLVVAETEAALVALTRFADGQRAAGVDADIVAASELGTYEPELASNLAGGCYYPKDAQVQPMLAAARLLAGARAAGAQVRVGVEVTGVMRDGDRVVGVRTATGDQSAGAVVNAAGTWAGEVASLARVNVPVTPRRGFILVTEPLPPIVRHKVYASDYVAAVSSDDARLQTSPVVEGTRSGTILIGSSRERVGLDRTLSVEVLQRLAEAAVRLFPVLAGVNAIRAYCGFRPYSPDHLPIIGSDPRAPGLVHACGHEGAGVGLAPATGELVAAVLSGQPAAVDPAPFGPERFE
ncbi:MAG TPA: FAD-binding oxidoreductase [Jiangellaceae bacterium]|nr:FAD-binding oxidoreductase [Jiangellaceae bacterium]